MAAIVFDGKAFGAAILQRVRDEVTAAGQHLRMATIYDSRNEASKVYTKLKARTARELGILFEAHDVADEKLAVATIKALNKDEEIRGVMVQLPLVERGVDERLCQMIRKEKDVDGLNPASAVMPATVRAVAAVVAEGLQVTGKGGKEPLIMLVVGSRGNVGRGVMKLYKGDTRFRLVGAGRGELVAAQVRRADIVVSAVGEPGLIKAEMIKPGAIVVDVGYPGGDVQPTVQDRAGFYTPVPGGVGPVTVAMLFRNLIDLSQLKAA